MMTTTRMSATERREEILVAALAEFAERGLHGTSTDDIARRAGISQPYLFRLFGTKKELFIAAIERCLEETRDAMVTAAAGRRGEEALEAMGQAYMGLLADRSRLRAQMQAYAACDDPEVCQVVRAGFGRLYEAVDRVAGVDRASLGRFFAKGMLLNVVASMDLMESPEGWAKQLIEGCKDA